MAAITKQFYQGQSLTIGVFIGADYNMANLQEGAIIIGFTKYTATVIGHMLRFELSSEDTQSFVTSKNVNLIFDDAHFGRREYVLGTLSFLPTKGQTFDTSIDEGYTVVFNMTVNETTITVDSIMYDYVIGKTGTTAYESYLATTLDDPKLSEADWSDSFKPDPNTVIDSEYAADKLRLANTSGTNTGDQDLSGYSLTTHNHSLANLTERSYNSLTDKPNFALLEDVTYAELTAKIAASTLKVGQKYIITDHQTVHIIPNTTSLNEGQIEPLIVESVTNSKLANECKSTLFPQDIIYYDVESNQTMVPGCTKGYIYRRIDTLKNNDIGFDYRNVKFRRWQMGVGTESVDGNETFLKGSVVLKAGTNEVYIKLNNADATFDTNSHWKLFEWANLSYIIPIDSDWDVANIIIANSGLYFDFYLFSTEPTINGVQSNYDNIYKNIFSGNNSNIIAKSNSVLFGDYFYANTIGNNFYSNTIGNYFYYNTIGDVFNYNTIGNNFNSNTIGNDFNSNTIGNEFNNNTIGNVFNYNIIGNNFQYNTIGNVFSYNGGLDFTSAFYVYQSYQKKLFTDKNNNQLLSYIDEFGVENIVIASSPEITE